MTEAFQLSAVPAAPGPDLFEKVVAAWEEICSRPRTNLSETDLEVSERALCGIAIKVMREELKLEPEVIAGRLGIPTTHVRLLTVEMNRILMRNVNVGVAVKGKLTSLRTQYKELTRPSPTAEEIAELEAIREAAAKVRAERVAERERKAAERKANATSWRRFPKESQLRARAERTAADEARKTQRAERKAKRAALEQARGERRLARAKKSAYAEIRSDKLRVRRTFARLRECMQEIVQRRINTVQRLHARLVAIHTKDVVSTIRPKSGVDTGTGAELIRRAAFCFWVHPGNILGPHRSYDRDATAARRAAMVVMLRLLDPTKREISVAKFFDMGFSDVRTAERYVDSILDSSYPPQHKVALEQLCEMYGVSTALLHSSRYRPAAPP